MSVINTHLKNNTAFKSGCDALCSLLEGNQALQLKMCTTGNLEKFLTILEKPRKAKQVSESCCAVIGITLSSQATHSIYCTPKVLEAVKKCHDNNKRSKQIEGFFKGLKREENPNVRSLIEQNICTRVLCSSTCRDCKCDVNTYCPSCCIQQKAYRCLTCSKEYKKIFCESCWKKEHQNHTYEEFFYPMRCVNRINANSSAINDLSFLLNNNTDTDDESFS